MLAEKFLNELSKAINHKMDIERFSLDSVTFLFENAEQLQEETPETNHFLQVTDLIDVLDGYDTGVGTPEHFQALAKRYTQALAIYKKETQSKKTFK